MRSKFCLPRDVCRFDILRYTSVHALTVTCLAPGEERAGVWRERPCTKRHRRLRGQSHLESHPSKPFNDTLAPLTVCTYLDSGTAGTPPVFRSKQRPQRTGMVQHDGKVWFNSSVPSRPWVSRLCHLAAMASRSLVPLSECAFHPAYSIVTSLFTTLGHGAEHIPSLALNKKVAECFGKKLRGCARGRGMRHVGGARGAQRPRVSWWQPCRHGRRPRS